MRMSRRVQSLSIGLLVVLSPAARAAAQTPRVSATPRAPLTLPAQPIAAAVKPAPTSPVSYQVVVWQNGTRAVTGALSSFSAPNGGTPAAGASSRPQAVLLTLPTGSPAAVALWGLSACVAPACRLEIDQFNSTGQVANAYLLNLAVRMGSSSPPPPAAMAGPTVTLGFVYQVLVIKQSSPATSVDDWDAKD